MLIHSSSCLRRRLERAALPRSTDGSNNAARHSIRATIHLVVTDDGLPVSDRREPRIVVCMPLEADARRLSLFTMHVQSVLSTVRMSGVRLDIDPLDASGALIPASVPTSKLDRGAVAASEQIDALFLVSDSLS